MKTEESQVLERYSGWVEEHLWVYKALQKKGYLPKGKSAFVAFKDTFTKEKIKPRAGRKDQVLSAQTDLFEMTLVEKILPPNKDYDETDQVLVKDISRRGKSVDYYEISLPDHQERRKDEVNRKKTYTQTAQKAGLTKLEFDVWFNREYPYDPPTFKEISIKLKNSASSCKTHYSRAINKIENLQKNHVDQKRFN